MHAERAASSPTWTRLAGRVATTPLIVLSWPSWEDMNPGKMLTILVVSTPPIPDHKMVPVCFVGGPQRCRS